MPKLTKAQQKKYRPVLLDLLQRLGGTLTRMEESVLMGDGDSSSDEGDDLGGESSSREFQLGLLENEDEIMQLVRASLDRLEEGNFGVCEGCVELIPPRRLEALPYARYCVPCQTQSESGTLGDD
jgi:DnaK suppressor protein